MAKIDETTEIKTSLKTAVAIIFFVVSASAYIIHMEDKVNDLEMKITVIVKRFEQYKNQPSRSHTDIEKIKTDIEWLKSIINK